MTHVKDNRQIATYRVSLIYILSSVSFALFGFGSGNVMAQEAEKLARVMQITDIDAKGNVTAIRTNVKHDAVGRRIENRVINAEEKLIATERLRYNSDGLLSGREYLLQGKSVKWRWKNIKYNENKLPVRNDIVNAKGKKIGWYTWEYKDGKLVKRSRFNADGSLRFYFANIKFDSSGNYSEWTKYDNKGNKTGVKQWKFAQ